MKVLVTGAGGWLGSELTKQLLDRGEKVRALTLNSSKKLTELKSIFGGDLEIIQGSICSEEIIDTALKDVKKVFHLAAKVHCQPKNEEEIKEFFKINEEGSKLLFEKCLEKKVKRVIFYSTVAVYGESEKRVDINTIKKPVTPYAKSKDRAEEYAMKLYKEKGLKITIVQPVTVYGGDDIGNFEKLKSFSEKGFLPKFGKGENKKTIIYFKDLIQTTVKIGEREEFIGKVIICGAEVITINKIIEVFKGNNKNLKVIKINKGISRFIECLSMRISPLNKLGRQIHVLESSNEFEIGESKKLIEKPTWFKDYYGQGERK